MIDLSNPGSNQRNVTSNDRWFVRCVQRFQDRIYEADGVTPQDITGWSFDFLLKKRSTDADAAAILHKSTADGSIVVTDAVLGVIEFTVSALDTATVAPGTYVFEIKRTDVDAETILKRGSCALLASLHLA